MTSIEVWKIFEKKVVFVFCPPPLKLVCFCLLWQENVCFMLLHQLIYDENKVCFCCMKKMCCAKIMRKHCLQGNSILPPIEIKWLSLKSFRSFISAFKHPAINATTYNVTYICQIIFSSIILTLFTKECKSITLPLPSKNSRGHNLSLVEGYK